MPNDGLNGNSPEGVNDHSSIKSVKSSDTYGTFEQNGDGTSTQRTAQAVDRSSDSENDDRPDTGPLWKQWLSFGIWFVYDQWFLFGLSLLILVSWRIQVPQAQQSLKETVVTYLCVAVIFFVTGCTLPTQVLVQNYKRWRLHLFCQIQSFFLTSVIVFGIVSACASNPNFMDGGLLVGLIFTGCVPTTISSNVIMTKQANGNQALTVVQSTLGNFLGPFVAPLLILMYLSCNAWYTDIVPNIATGEFRELYRRVFKQLGLSIFLPLAVGQVVRQAFPNATSKVFTEWKVSKVGSLALLLIIWQTYDGAFASGAFDNVEPSNIIFLVFISIAFYALWTITCFSLSLLWLCKEDAIAVAYVVPAKTPAIGVPLSGAMFAGLSPITASKIQIPMVIFQGLQVAAGSLLTLVFRRWMESGEKKQGNPNGGERSTREREEDDERVTHN